MHSDSPITGNDNHPSATRERQIQVYEERQEIMKRIAEGGYGEVLHALRRPRTAASLLYIVRSTLIVAGSTALLLAGAQSHFMPLLLLAACLLTARCIRSFGNQVHEGIHGNLSRNRPPRQKWLLRGLKRLGIRSNMIVNDLILKFLLVPLMFYCRCSYATEHFAHHGWLGTEGRDLEKLAHQVPRASRSAAGRFGQLFKFFFLDPKLWLSSLLGDLPRMRPAKLAFTLAWWCLLLSLVALLSNVTAAGVFAGLWLLTRMSFYHLLKVFAELCDHFNLEQHSIIGYTRTMPDNYLSFILHPDNDSYHTAHHLFDDIPMPNLPKAHVILLNAEKYRKGNHMKAYFTGRETILQSLIRTGTHASDG